MKQTVQEQIEELRRQRDELPEGSVERSRVEDRLAELDGPETRPF
jgi:hypothetical protein